MLRACKRVLRPGGAIALATIELSPGLTRAQRRFAVVAAPRAAASRRPYVELLAAAGFADIGHRDVSDEFRTTAQAWLDASLPRRQRLEQADGAAAVAEKLQGWREEIEATANGWVRRTLYWARRPD